MDAMAAIWDFPIAMIWAIFYLKVTPMLPTKFLVNWPFSSEAEGNKNSVEGVIAPAGAKITGATIRTWLLNKFISFLAVLSWKTGLKKI